MKELSYLLERFIATSGSSVLDDALYQELVTYDDRVLWEAFMTPYADASFSEDLRSLIRQIRETQACDQTSSA